MIDENLSLMRAHGNNIARYRKLLKTSLTDLERQFIERRVAEEQSAMEEIAASTLPSVVQAAGFARNHEELVIPIGEKPDGPLRRIAAFCSLPRRLSRSQPR